MKWSPTADGSYIAQYHETMGSIFSGHRGEAFLTRIDEVRDFLPIRDAELIKAVQLYLRTAALVWYRGHAYEFSTWEIAKLAFRRYYADPDYQIALRQEIADRTQAEGK